MSELESAIAAEKEAEWRKVMATHPLIQSALLTVRFEPDRRGPFAPWRYELALGDHGLVLAGHGHTMTQAAERAAESMAEYMSHVSDAGRGVTQ